MINFALWRHSKSDSFKRALLHLTPRIVDIYFPIVQLRQPLSDP